MPKQEGDVNILSQRNNSNDICLFCGELGHNKELRYCRIICYGWVLAGCSSAETAVTCVWFLCLKYAMCDSRSEQFVNQMRFRMKTLGRLFTALLLYRYFLVFVMYVYANSCTIILHVIRSVIEIIFLLCHDTAILNKCQSQLWFPLHNMGG
jgi:hypothetical protein